MDQDESDESQEFSNEVSHVNSGEGSVGTSDERSKEDKFSISKQPQEVEEKRIETEEQQSSPQCLEEQICLRQL